MIKNKNWKIMYKKTGKFFIKNVFYKKKFFHSQVHKTVMYTSMRGTIR